MRLQSAMEHLNLLGKGSSKQQSAMEYLMTYGWAILIIAVVLGVLYYLGVFNSSNLAPRLQPGSCHVARTSAGVQNFGVCAGLPEFVAWISVNAISPITISPSSQLVSNSFTVSMWIYLDGAANCRGLFSDWPDGGSGFVLIGGATFGCSVSYIDSDSLGWPAGSDNLPYNTWEMATLEYNGSSGVATVYVNDKVYTSGNLASGLSLTQTEPYYIGATGWGSETGANAYMANIQLYNTTLSVAEIHALYMEGIGGAPIVPQSVVGWWPLNGDANDYSGNNNNGQANNVQYTNTWLSSYGAP